MFRHSLSVLHKKQLEVGCFPSWAGASGGLLSSKQFGLQRLCHNNVTLLKWSGPF